MPPIEYSFLFLQIGPYGLICQRKAVAKYIRVFPLTASMHGNTKNYNSKNYNSKNYNSKNYNSKNYNFKNYSSKNYNSKNYNSKNYNSCRYQTRSWILPRTSYPISLRYKFTATR